MSTPGGFKMSASDRARMRSQYPFFEFIFKNRSQKGHAQSMNLLHDTVSTPYWLHLEDDWHFFVTDRYIEKALAILEDDEQIGQVLFNYNYVQTTECRKVLGGTVKWTHGGVRYRLHDHIPYDTDDYNRWSANLPPGGRSDLWWPHYSLRPSLQRTAALKDVGSYDPEASHFELDFAERYTKKGYVSAFFDAIYALHIGKLTWDTTSGAIANAYALNSERQFGKEPAKRRLRVKLIANWTSSQELCEIWKRQSKGDLCWGEIEVTSDDGPVDYYAVINHPHAATDDLRPDRTIIFHMEPRCAVLGWGQWAAPDPREFLQVRSHDRYRNVAEWHLDMTYAELIDQSPSKTRGLSAVVSGKVTAPGQRLRVAFLHHLETLGFPVDIYGHETPHGFSSYQGSLPYMNKKDGILPYRYTFNAENNAENNYFSEKIVDAILGECLCFYWGCPNLEDYIDPRAFIRLPLDDHKESHRIVDEAIRSDQWSERIDVIRAEKQRILDEYQFFPTLSRVVHGHVFAENLDIEVINLDWRPDRWSDFLTATQQAAGAAFVARCRRFPAIDGHKIGLTPEIKHTFRDNLFDYRRSIVACALSHMAIRKKIAGGDGRACLILEDDALLADDFVRRLEIVTKATPPEAPLCMLSAIFWWEVPLPNVSEQAVVCPDQATVPVPAGSHAYFVRREGYPALIAALSTFEQGVDDSRRVAVEGGLGYCLALPFLASLVVEDSDIGDVNPETTTIDDIHLRRTCVERYFAQSLPAGDPRDPQ